MPIVALQHIVSFSSEDKVHCAENLLKGNTEGKWRCAEAGEKQASVIIQLEKATTIHSIDIGNDGSAFIEVLVSRSTGEESYKVLLVASSFMSLSESRSGSGANRVRMFSSDKLSQDVMKDKWDRIKVVCTQPFNKHAKYGLHFINLHTTEQPNSPTTIQTKDNCPSSAEKHTSDQGRTTFGAFTLKPESSTSTPSARPAGSNILQKSPQQPLQPAAVKRKIVPTDQPPVHKKPKLTSPFVSAKAAPSKQLRSPPANPTRDSNASNRMGSSKMKDVTVRSKEKQNVSTELGRVLRKVVFAISGFQNPQRGEIRDKALLMGAQYKKDWDKDCTHLICAFRNTPKYLQVVGTSGHVVRADWISDCYDMKRKLPRKNYNMRPDDSSESSSDDEPQAPTGNPYDESTDEEESPDTEEEVERIFKKRNEQNPESSIMEDEKDPYDESTDEEDNFDELPPLPEYFKGRHFFLHGDFQPNVERMLKRHIITCDGAIANYMSDEVRYVITEASWQDEFDDVLADNASVAFVRPAWVFECGQAKRLLPYQSYTVPS